MLDSLSRPVGSAAERGVENVMRMFSTAQEADEELHGDSAADDVRDLPNRSRSPENSPKIPRQLPRDSKDWGQS
ncbi:hypothetical protein AB3X96_39800 [Paraburkholderia sp. BR13439]|uniref:hypothetical protein n=1 Tax=Paraburkholderia TaxID=1822464 RepID=UPI0034CF8A16